MIKKYYSSTIIFLLLFPIILFGVELLPIPTEYQVDHKKVQLGKKLFSDTILSKDHTLSCLSCHNLKYNGADTTAYTKGIDGRVGYFNVPTVYNAKYNFRQFWDGRAKNLQGQALNPIINPTEMGNTISAVLKVLKSNNEYLKAFQDIFEDGITENNLAEVLTEFEKTLITPHAPLDKYLKGDKTALGAKALKGYRLFKAQGCIYCHNGVNVGGNLYNKFGIYEDANSREFGRYNITHKETDKYVFKVPSLRNIALTAPYMHDGRAKTLKDAINIMSKYQLGHPMDADDLEDIVAFLLSLTGELPQIVKDINVSH